MTTKEILCAVRTGRMTEEAAEAALAGFEDMGFAMVDHAREARRGFPEVIYGEGKTAEEIAGIFPALASSSAKSILATRVSEEKAAAVRSALPDLPLSYDARARLLYLKRAACAGEADDARDRLARRRLLVLTAGTSDIPVAEEARLVAELMGIPVTAHYDCGVAGIHRLFAHLEDIRAASAIIVCAGMEGALASVVGGLSPAPVIAVPTSVGYGASLGGISALLSMLNSCASGVAVVNIDNGFGAAMLAAHMLAIA